MGKIGQKVDAHERARQMMIAGEDWNKIREETRLREKDLTRIQKEITQHF